MIQEERTLTTADRLRQKYNHWSHLDKTPTQLSCRQLKVKNRGHNAQEYPSPSSSARIRIVDTRGIQARPYLDLSSRSLIRPYVPYPINHPFTRYHDEEDARRVFESGEQFSLDGRKLEVQYAQGRRKTPNQMRGARYGSMEVIHAPEELAINVKQGGRGDRRRSRSADRHYRPSSRRYSRSRSRSRSPVRRRRDSRSPVRRGRSRSRTPPRRGSRRSPSPRRHSRSRSPRGRSTSRDRRSRSRSPRRSRGRYTPSPERGPKMGNGGGSTEPSSSAAPDNRPEQGEIAEQGEFVEF
ncbi:hypothetical protein BGX26_001799 [Mortierella sp. AD094]|nr:hypothetical protein BGX26_001799 [Mortierella sp. AD094]